MKKNSFNKHDRLNCLKDNRSLEIPSGKLAYDPVEEAQNRMLEEFIKNPPDTKNDYTRDPTPEELKRFAELLMGGKVKIKVTATGDISFDGDNRNISIPPGKLASKRLRPWYEEHPELFKEEQRLMNKYFPGFTMNILSNGQCSWEGTVYPKSIRKNAAWVLQLVYDNNHPNKNGYGGSVKIYSVYPDLEFLNAEIKKKTGETIPHLLRDSNNHLCLCTSRTEDFADTYGSANSAASCLAWAVKWIWAFELWRAGAITTKEFKEHRI